MKPDLEVSSDESFGSIDFRLTIKDFDKELSEKTSDVLKRSTISFRPEISKQASINTLPYLSPKVSLVTVTDLLRKDPSVQDRNVNMFAINTMMGSDEELMQFPSADYRRIKVEKFQLGAFDIDEGQGTALTEPVPVRINSPVLAIPAKTKDNAKKILPR